MFVLFVQSDRQANVSEQAKNSTVPAVTADNSTDATKNGTVATTRGQRKHHKHGRKSRAQNNKNKAGANNKNKVTVVVRIVPHVTILCCTVYNIVKIIIIWQSLRVYAFV